MQNLSYDVFTVCGLSEVEIRPAFDGALRINYSVYFLIENQLVHLPIEETLDWDENSGFWKATFAFQCYLGSLGSEIVNADYSAGGEYDLDQAGPSSWSGAIRYTDNHEHAPKPDSTLVLHRIDAETIRIELKDRQEEKFKNDPSRLRELDLTFKRVPE